MKTLKIQNQSIVRIHNLLSVVNFKNKAILGRVKFQKRLDEKLKEYQDDLTIIQKDYFVVDEDGNLKSTDDGVLTYKEDITVEQKQESRDRSKELLEDYAEISFSEYSTKYEAMFEKLVNDEMEHSGEEGLAYAELVEAYEEASENKTEEEK